MANGRFRDQETIDQQYASVMLALVMKQTNRGR